ncbi:MAG TPA: M1 family metallopeptidase [Terracidiphilus sp.]|nr:M1 family metallopeptidase [Terracidiphilus sp.]
MSIVAVRRWPQFVLVLFAATALILSAQNTPRPASPSPAPTATAPSHADILRGAYGPYRANNDLLYYHLEVRVDPEKKFISGSNTIRFRMLQDGTRIQLDLYPDLKVDKILLGSTPLKYSRDEGAVFVDFPSTLRKGRIYTIVFYYEGYPKSIGRFGGITFGKDPAGRAWVVTSCEDDGASIWWPNKDQWRDEVQKMEISVAIPDGLVDVSNGKFMGKTDLHDGYTRWDWFVHYPINNYDVALNIGDYVHFHSQYGSLPLDYYVLPEDLEKAKTQFAQVPGMLDAFTHYFGPYPFPKDGYKLVEVPYSGMEHQSAVAYGNEFANGYLKRNWTNTPWSLKFDFIIIHESAHEWFGNSITAADRSDMWIHEGWATYLELLYVEYHWGHEASIEYLNGLKPKVHNRRPILCTRGTNCTPTEDEYFKGALMLNTLRSVVNNDKLWFKVIRGFYQHFKYQNILTEQVVAYFNQATGMDLTPIFNQYLRHTSIPTLELKFDAGQGTVSYRWKADEPDFAMPVRVGRKGDWTIVRPVTSRRQTIKTPLDKSSFGADTDLYYVNVEKS